MIPAARVPLDTAVKEGVRRQRAARWVFAVLAVALLPLMVVLSRDFGVTWDEGARHSNGTRVWEYLNGEREVTEFERGGRVYGGLFDVIAVVAERELDANRYVLRHAINAVFGWAGIVFTGALAARLFGPWPGVLAMVLLASSPRYFADSMNNPKDLPFAAASVAALYAMSTMSAAWPYISRGTAFGLIVTLAAALNIRPAAILYFGFFGLLLVAFVVLEPITAWRRLVATAARAAIIVVAALLVGTTFWPWAQQAPLTRPFEALFLAADYPWAGRVLFNGINYRAPDLPWYYPSVWLAISTPPVVIVGLMLAVGPSARTWMWRRLALAFVAFLPVALIVLKDSTVYDGIRHLLFIYPVLVVLATSGWMAALASPRGWVRGGAAALLVAGLANILIAHVRLHPNQTVYFNEFVGGPRGALGRFDLDYWGNCMLQAVEWSAEQARLQNREITVSGWPAHLVQQNAARFPELDFDRRNHEFRIQLNRGSSRTVSDLTNRDDASHRIETPDGAPLCLILPGSVPSP